MDEILSSDTNISLNRRDLFPCFDAEQNTVRGRIVSSPEEQAKWDAIYAVPPPEESPWPIRAFSEQLADRIGELLPQGGRVLEAGCGTGWQSMVLAERGNFEVSLLDFSPKALQCAEHTFAQHRLSASFICQDAFQLGEPNFDLVFNVGVLEHYSFEQQVDLLRGMASRSRGYVLALVPNRLCYWYWIWRTQASAAGKWPFGKEIPTTNLADVFEAAGMKFFGHWFGGEKWTEQIIRDIPGLEEGVREQILAVHRSPLIPPHQKSHLTAALGTVDEAFSAPACWTRSAESEAGNIDRLSAALSDSMAAIFNFRSFQEKNDLQYRQAEQHREKTDELIRHVDSRLEQFREQQRILNDRLQREYKDREQGLQRQIREKDRVIEKMTRQCDEGASNLKHLQEDYGILQNELIAKRSQLLRWEEIARSRGFRFLKFLYRMRTFLMPCGSRREQFARSVFRMLNRRFQRDSRTLAVSADGQAARQTPSGLQIGTTIDHAGNAEEHASLSRFSAPRDSIHVKDLVSVVLPVYNHAHMLEKAIESVLAQTYRYFELIIVDDGSTDGAAEVLAKYASHPKVRILTQENQKLPHALSNGFLFARGEYWTWTSADNFMHPNQLRRQVEFLQANEDAAMVYADYLAIDDAGKMLHDSRFRPHNRRSPNDPAIHLPRSTEDLCTVKDNFIGPCFLYRGWVGRLLDQYDDNLGVEDYDYWMRMNSAFHIAHLGTDETLYRYRIHDDSLSGRAVELGIHERADRLMLHQERRMEYFDRPWTIYVDGPMWNRLGENTPVSHRFVRWSGEAVQPRDGEKTMFLVEAGSLPRIANPPHKTPWTVAAWFDGDAYAPHVFRGDIRRTRAVCFAKDDITLHRLALTTAKVFTAESTETMLALAIREANDRTFREANRSPKEHERKPPCVFRDEGRPLNILLQVDSFTQGGMEQVVIDLAESLDPKYFSPSLLLLGEGGDAVARARDKNLRVILLPENEMEDGYRKLLEEEKIDLINAHYSLFGANFAAEKGIPFVQTIHNTYVWITAEQRAKYLANDQFTTAYTCVSNMVAHYSDVKLGLPPEKMLIFPNGIDASRFEEEPTPEEREETRAKMGFSPNDFVFLNVGTILPTKAQIELVHAFERVVERHSNAKLLILGRSVDAKHLAELEWHIDRLHLNRDVILGGHREDIVPHYWAADALVLPSLWEGWSLAMIEAACAGLPIIATNVGGALEMFDDVAGTLIAPPFESITDLEESTIWDYLKKNDPTFISDLANAMISICDDRPRTMQTESIRRKFDRKNTYRKYEDLFLWLTQGGHPSALRRWRLMSDERSEFLAAARTRRAA